MIEESFSMRKIWIRNLGVPGFALILFAIQVSGAFAQGEVKESNLRQWIGVDIFAMVRSTDIVGKISLVLLAGFSIASWSIIVYKFLHIRQASIQTDAFVKICNSGSGQLDEAFKAAADFPDSPLAQILRECYLELEIENWYREGYHLDSAGRVDLAKVGIERVFERTITNELTHLESKLVFLAMTTNVCPFIGLFGTVWGIMVAFQSFGLGGNVSISSLAPGLSTALLVTVGGLFCAIPSSIMYNDLTNKVRILTARMDAFALELSNIVQKQILKQAA
jgi:biopolymer transport protein TolQ